MWLTEPELFLYSKSGGKDVQVWRCKKPMISSSSSPPLIVPMIPDDFEYVSQVQRHSDLIDEDLLDWEETDYKILVNYISERRLLVNSQGLVIVELWKSSGGNQVDANALPIYLRSHDILSLKDYIPNFRERPIPLRKVQYLEDINGKAAPVLVDGGAGDSTNTTKQVVQLQEDLKRERNEKLELAKRVADTKTKNKKLEAENMDLHGTNTKLKQDRVDTEAKNKTLEAENVNLNDTNTKQKQDLADADAKNKKLEAENVNLHDINTKQKQDLSDAEAKNKKLEAENMNLHDTNTKLKKDLADAEAKDKKLEAENVNLNDTNTKLKKDLAARENEVTDLKSKVKTSVEKVTKLTEDVDEWKQKLTELKSKTKSTSDDQEKHIKKLNADVVEWRDKAGRLESTNKTQEETIRRLNADVQRANQESWRNDIDVTRSDKWLAAEALRNLTWTNKITILRGQGTYTVDDQNSNVRASYWCQVRLGDNVKPFKGVAIRDLAPNREKARFKGGKCFNVNANGGILYVLCSE